MKRIQILLLIPLLVACGRPSTEEPKPVARKEAPAPPPAPPQCTPAPDRLCPVDEGTRDPSFAAYRQRLIAALETKNKAALLDLMDPHMRTSFGADNGRRELDWDEVLKAVRMGGSFREGSFWAPYVYSAWPDEVDAFTHAAATRAGVPLRSEPSESASVVRTLDWAIVELVDSKDPAWRHVRTKDGTTGWAKAEDVRRPIGYRAGFNKTGSDWKMTAFVEGD
jgi:hypothetical protein